MKARKPGYSAQKVGFYSLILILLISFAGESQSHAVTMAQEPSDSEVYLPSVLNNYPPLPPEAPVLNEINNDDGDGNYTVSWSASQGADTYTLQEDQDAGFSSPTTAYSGSNTSQAISGRDVGTYYYRVRASNLSAQSEWSNVRSVVVTTGPEPPPDCPQAGEWIGNTSQGHSISFVVENTPTCKIAEDWRILVVDSCGNDWNFIGPSLPIINGHFEISTVGWQVTGDFTSPNEANGTFELRATQDLPPYECEASGTWTAKPNTGLNGPVNAIVVQPDGKILVGGSFTMIGDVTRNRIVRLNPDGSLDTSFDSDANDAVRAIAVQPDGKILVGGIFTEMGGEIRNRIARLNPDGSLDTGFDPDANDEVRAIAVQPDGKILVGGKFSVMGGETRSLMARLNQNGTVDTGFVSGIYPLYSLTSRVNAIAVQPDTEGKILVAGQGIGIDGRTQPGIARLNPDGSQDLDFNPREYFSSGSVNSFAFQSDGKIVLGGLLSTKTYVTVNIVRLNQDGSIDTSFIDPGSFFVLLAVTVDSDDNILVGGFFSSIGGVLRSNIGRLNPDGSLDTGFFPVTNSDVYVIELQEGGKILVGGTFTTLNGETINYLGRLNDDGSLDTSFMH